MSFIAGVLMLLSLPASAVDKDAPYQQCFVDAAQKQGVPHEVLMAIAKQESNFNPNAINRSNKDGSSDYGIMQINSWWLPELKKQGVGVKDLMNPCINIHIGAWIFAQGVAKHGWTWKGIGAYNARSDHFRYRYAQNVIRHWKTMAENNHPRTGG